MSNQNYINNNSKEVVNKNSRLTVIQTLLKVQNGLSLSALLDPLLTKSNPQDKGFIHALLLTTLRHWHATARLMDSLAKQPIEELEVRTTIQVGMTQLLYLEVADHACIFETVEAIKKLGFGHASGLVNAILRKVSSNTTKYRKKCDKKHSLPNWLAQQLKQDWSECYDELTDALRYSASLYLRANARQTTAEEYGQKLSNDSINYEIETLTTQLHVKNNTITNTVTDAIRLEQSTNVTHLPNFEIGEISVQDVHAMLSGSLVSALAKQMMQTSIQADIQADIQQTDKTDVTTPLHILDACTAPSGKLAHCLELLDNTVQIKFTAIDNDSARLERSQQTLERIGLENEAKLVCADATRWQLSRDEPQQFDIILLDAPCTATGVIRRHPDISLLRQESDVEQTVAIQATILDNLWQQLKPNGYMIYATCSLLKAENTEQMQEFVTRHNDANTDTETQEKVAIIEIDGNWGIKQEIGRQCLPLKSQGGDGFYYAVLQKIHG